MVPLHILLLGVRSGPVSDPDRIDLAVVTDDGNHVEGLTRAELVALFRAERASWNRDTPVTLFLPPAGAPARGFLLRSVYGMSEAELERHWIELLFHGEIPRVPAVPHSDAVALTWVARTHGALALVGAELAQGARGVRILSVDGRRPGEAEYWPRVAGERSQSGPVAARPAALRSQVQQSDLEKRLEAVESRLEEEAEAAAAQESEGLLDLGPKLSLRGFGDIRYGIRTTDSDDPARDGSSSEFALGQLDLFTTSTLTRRISFLNETVFEVDDQGSTVVDVERLQLKYDFGDAINLKVGRVHTALGYWNTAFHHGEWVQTTIGRPRIFDFEDENGILPVHLVGLGLEASHDLAPCGIRGTLEVGNGRGPTPDPPQVASDANDSKAINLALYVMPHAVEGLQLGAGLYLDEIPPNADPVAGALHGSLDERIWNLSAVWRSSPWVLLGELFGIQHEDGGDARSSGWYLQLERTWGRWTPYARVEAVDLDDADTFYASTDDLERALIGLRWNLSTWDVVKLQIARSKIAAAPGNADEDSTEIALQTAFTF